MKLSLCCIYESLTKNFRSYYWGSGRINYTDLHGALTVAQVHFLLQNVYIMLMSLTSHTDASWELVQKVCELESTADSVEKVDH